MPENTETPNPIAMKGLIETIKQTGRDLGFQHIGITNTQLDQDALYLKRWLEAGHHGNMGYMQRHGDKRSQPQSLHPGTITVISARMDYIPEHSRPPQQVLQDKTKGYVSRYALGRDYHKMMRKRLQQLAHAIQAQIGDFNYRAFVDSAPVLEKALAQKAGLGWIGKHTNLVNKKEGSWFFLGEIYTDLPLPLDTPSQNHCGHCRACLDICPTNAFVGPYQLDARRCISYLTIELREAIPVELRPLIGNRIYGCDDCQLVCPWNRFANFTTESDFSPRHQLDDSQLIHLFAWSEADFLDNTAGSAIRRIGYECWLRNIAVALGNAPISNAVIQALQSRQSHPSPLVQEHTQWALAQHGH